MADHALEPVLAEVADEPSGRLHRRCVRGGVACAGLALVALAVLAHRVPYFSIDLTITRARPERAGRHGSISAAPHSTRLDSRRSSESSTERSSC